MVLLTISLALVIAYNRILAPFRRAAICMRPPTITHDPSIRVASAYLALNVAVLFFLLAPIAIVFVFALNPTPYIQFPPVGVSLRWFESSSPRATS